VSAAQLIQDGTQWKRSLYLYGSREHGSFYMRHLFVSKGFFIIRAAAGTRLYKVRDYREVDSPELQAPYDEALQSKGDSDLPFCR
jgi:hypothetical protein